MRVSYTKVLPVIFLEFLVGSLLVAVLPELQNDFFGDNAFSVVGWSMGAKGVLSFLFSPGVGALSDRHGRKWFLFVTAVGSSAPVIFLLFTENMWPYSIANAASGVFAATLSLIFAYIADCVELRERTAAFSIAYSTFGLALVVGPVTGSLIARFLGRFAVFITSSMCLVLNALYIVFVLPETPAFHYDGIEPPALPPITWREINPFQGIELLWSSKLLWRLALLTFFYYLTAWGVITTFLLYLDRRFGWTSTTNGILMSVFGFLALMAQGCLVGPLAKRFGESTIVKMGLLLMLLFVVLFGVASERWHIFVGCTLGALGFITFPAVTSLVSHEAAPSRQGEAQGAINGVRSLTEGVGPIIFGLLLPAFERTSLPGAPFLIGGSLVALAFLISLTLPEPTEFAGKAAEVFSTSATSSPSSSAYYASTDVSATAESVEEDEVISASGWKQQQYQHQQRRDELRPLLP